MIQLKDLGPANPKRLLQGLEQHLKVVVRKLQQLPNCNTARTAQSITATVKRLERAKDTLTRLVGSPSFIAAFSQELAKHSFATVEPRAYIEHQKGIIRNLKLALESHGSCQTDGVGELFQVIEAVAKHELRRGRPKNPNYAILDQIIIFEAPKFRNRTGKRPTIFIDEKTGHPGPFLRQVLDAIAAKNLDFSYEQIQYRMKLLKVHPVHGAHFH